MCGEGGQIVNLYGLTETSLAKLFYLGPAEPPPGVQPIGRAIADTQALVLNNGRLTGVGETGEIVIRTPFRTRGYVNVPDQNSEQLRTNPFRDDPGDLLYYTGDLGRYRPDGVIQFLGRRDRQVKVSGARVEPGEIEAVLGQHPAVWSSHVVPAAVGGQQRLVAYVATPTSITAADLRRHCAARLPAYMLPAHFVVRNELPLLANGKVDRSALPLPEAAPEGAPGFTPPATPTERAVAAIWAEVLDRPRVGASDNFFELGGHSLLATQITARLLRDLGVNLPVAVLFEEPTLAGLAQRIDGARRNTGG